jgi:hypothetical protein
MLGMGEVEEVGPAKPHGASEAAAAAYAEHLAKLHSTPAIQHDDNSAGGGGGGSDKVTMMGQRDRTTERVQAMRRAYEAARTDTQRQPKAAAGADNPEPGAASTKAEASSTSRTPTQASGVPQTPPASTPAATPQAMFEAREVRAEQQQLTIEVNADEAAQQAADDGQAPGQTVAESNAAATINYGKSSGRKPAEPSTSGSSRSSSAGRASVSRTHASVDISSIEDMQTLAAVLGASSPETSVVMSALNEVPWHFTPTARF